MVGYTQNPRISYVFTCCINDSGDQKYNKPYAGLVEYIKDQGAVFMLF
jgi:hypothetical protein